MTDVAPLHRRSRLPGSVDPRGETSIVKLTPDLLQWLDASQIQGKSDGDRVTSWADSSGNGNDMTAASSGPQYRPTGLSNKPSLEFSSTNCIMTASGLVVPTTEFTIFIVLNWSSGSRVFGLENNASGNDGLAMLVGLFGFYQWVIRNSGSNSDIGFSSSPTKAVISLRMGSGGAESKKNGDGANSNGQTAWSVPSGITQLHIGSSGNNGDHFAGHIAEWIVYNRKLSSTERDNIHAAMNTKYSGGGLY